MGAARLDRSELDDLVHRFFLKGLADSTLRSYKSAQKRYGSFCAGVGMHPLPASEEGLCRFVVKLAEEGLKHRTIKAYLSGVRHLHIMEGLADPFKQPLEQLHYVLRGVKRCEGEQGRAPRERLPISPEILRKIKAVWEQVQPVSHNRVMLWAACCLAFFGFLRAGELTVPGDDTFDAATHLTREDLAVDIPGSPTVFRVTLKASNLQERCRLVHWKGCPGPVSSESPGELPAGARRESIIFEDGRFLSRQRFVGEVRGALGKAGIDSSKYCRVVPRKKK